MEKKNPFAVFFLIFQFETKADFYGSDQSLNMFDS